LRAAHEQGVVHGDLKPQNLLVGPDGVLKVTDFGVARLVRRPTPHAEPGAAPRLVGAVVGTPEYMAPEQLLGQEPDTRTDMYAAGIVLHECITGATPFQADTPLGFFARKLEAAPAAHGERPGADRPDDARPRTLDAVIARMMAHSPESRPTFEELHDLLGRLA
jgi:serine/threonine-protein kinase